MLTEIINDAHRPAQERLDALRRYAQGCSLPPVSGEVNNHIHTVYSFSPYTPSMAALKAREAGLEVAGSVDHDSIGAAEEMLAACRILDMGCVVGFELRVSFKDTPFGDRKLNNPDSAGIVYMTVQGVAVDAIPEVTKFLTPIRERRVERTRRMTQRMNEVFMEASKCSTGRNACAAQAGMPVLHFEHDILARSKFAEGGGVTERHLLAAVADALTRRYGKGKPLVEGLEKDFNIKMGAKIAGYLSDVQNPHYLFDVLGVLKSTLLEQVFEQPDEAECIPARHAIDFARSIGAIPAYAYLGDIGESPTGDKKAEKFEDDFIEPLFAELCHMGYQGVTYMPPRNTVAQLLRVQRLCDQFGLMEISGVDINSSRQSFSCPEVLKPEFKHLNDSTWALVAHQQLVSKNRKFALCSSENPLAKKPLKQRIAEYAALGRHGIAGCGCGNGVCGDTNETG